MKSLYILCEYGISYSTIRNLNKKGITFSNILLNPDCLYKVWSRDSKKTKAIIEAVNRAKDDSKTKSIFDLGAHGISLYNIKKMFLKGITLKELFFLDVNGLQALTEFHIDSVIKLKETLQNLIHDAEYVDISNSIYISNLIEEAELNDFTETELIEIVRAKNKNHSFSFISKTLNELVENKKLTLNDNRYRIYVPTLEEAINNISNERYKQIIIKRFAGRTLERIGDELGESRQLIWKTFTKAKQQIPNVYEDWYKDIFEKYDFDVDSFCEINNVDEKVYYYLMERYTKGKKRIIGLLDDDNISEDIKKKLRNSPKLVKYNSSSIDMAKKKLLEEILKEKKVPMSMADLIELYNHEIIKNGYEMLVPLPSSDIRNVGYILSRSNKCVPSSNGRYRYFDFKSLSNSDVRKLQSLLSLSEGAYSSDFMFRNNTDLMKKINIHNYYELHNILRRINISNDVIFSRMPDLLIGCNDKVAFFQKIIDLYAPIKLSDFIEMVYSKYGHQKNTFSSFFSAHLQHYYSGGIIKDKSKVFRVNKSNRLITDLIKENSDKDKLVSLRERITNLLA